MRLEVLELTQLQAALPCGLDHRGGQRMFAAALQARCKTQNSRVAVAGRSAEGNYAWLSLSQSSRFIHNYSVYLLQHFEGFSIFDEHACGRSPACAHHDRHWGCQ